MTAPAPSALPEGGRLAANIMHFARALRAAGLPIGPGKVIAAIRAVETVGIANREDFYWALQAVFVNRYDQRELFDQAFHVFWKNPRMLERMMGLVLPTMRVPGAEEMEPLSRRIDEALGGRDAADTEERGREEPELTVDAVMTYSQREVLRTLDFEKMSADEVRRARELIRRMRLPIMDLPTRRFRPDPRGRRLDMRATLRASLRSGGHDLPLRRARRRRRHPPLVILCDISGSMSRYSRMILHFTHAITNERDRVHAFVFGTRLTNITRHLRHRDIDVSLEKVTDEVVDWSGGTRIGRCLREFNARWSRRVLAQGAVVLLITDGLDRDVGGGLAEEMERLHKSCRRLIWLNPLLRYEAFEPKSLGVKAILPEVDDFRPVHNLASLEALTEVLRHPGARREEGVSQWRKRMQ